MISFQINLKKLFLFSLLIIPEAFAHSIDERYDLPLPLHLFILGSGAIVFFSFLAVFLIFTKFNSVLNYPKVILNNLHQKNIIRCLKFCMQSISVLMFFVVLESCFLGNPNPLDNLAPNFIWITWWLGFSLLIAFLGNFWPLINPWVIIFQCIEKLFFSNRKVVISSTHFLPKSIHIATFFLLLWSWLELIYPIAFIPHQIGFLIIIWSLLSFVCMYLFGVSNWQNQIDFFSIYFSLLGKFGLFQYDAKKGDLLFRPFGFELTEVHQNNQIPIGLSAFIIAMLSTVLFDGLHGNQIWNEFETLIESNFPYLIDTNRYFIGTVSLLATWLIFFSIYQASCWIGCKFCSSLSTNRLSDLLAPSLIPIAIAYLVAHNFSSFIIQAQNIIYLISDPFHLGWNIFGTKEFRPNIAILDAGLIWYLALFSIVIGHILAIVISHFILLKITRTKREMLYLSLPITLIMVLLTMMSLIIIAEPMTN